LPVRIGTVSTGRTILVTFLELNGISGLLNKFAWLSFVDPIRPIYEPEELAALFDARGPAERLLFSTYLLFRVTRQRKCATSLGQKSIFGEMYRG
jgi:hypothetical protein